MKRENDDSYIECGDCYELIKQLPDKSIDLIVTDPPYEFVCGDSGGAFGADKRNYHKEYLDLYRETGKSKDTERLRIIANAKQQRDQITHISKGFEISLLEEFDRVMKATNIYIWCSKQQLGKIINYYESKKCNIDVLTWHKTNPIPTCNNTYLSDTEYLIFARAGGVKLYGTYATKKKYYVSPTNVKDKKLYKHPTIKPAEIIENLIINSSKEGDVILDPFAGSGTTCVCAKKLNRKYIGFEIDTDYFEIMKKRLNT